ncbi:hypothetical protein F5876DRAFT_71109 [Lentinula aff. lateritia]|uniref:Uncharacterized protein n=1 Tax=Lentinula aff. lateritia TaxID=2804960 RepID=A0ACC1TGH8_9AGAR|nr:hypothetical protein F5876DRAFT_71109 [Lentinula aff. lateritia]
MDCGFSTSWGHKGSCAFTAVAWRDSVLSVGNMDGEIITFHPTKVLESGIIRIICLTPVHLEKLRITAARQSWQRVLVFWEMMIVSWHIFTTGFGEKNKTMLYSLMTQDLMNRKFKIDAWENRRSWGPEEKIWFRSTPENVKKMGTSVDVQPCPQNIPLPVLFINKGQATIMGMTKGYIAIFKVKHGKRIQALKHGEDEIWVTALAYIILAGHCRMITLGEGNCGQRTRIVIWTQDEADGPILILMGVVFAMSWLISAQWRERESANFLQCFGRSFVPPPPPPPPMVPSATSTGQSPSLTKLKEFLISLEDLLVHVGLSIGI